MCGTALQVNWNKGSALEHLLGMLGLKGEQDVTTIYIGDDQTDEDAFRVLKETDQGGQGLMLGLSGSYCIRHREGSIASLIDAWMSGFYCMRRKGKG